MVETLSARTTPALPRGRSIPTLPAALVVTSSIALLLAAGLWVTMPGPVGIPLTPAELGPVLTIVGGFVLWRRPGQRVATLMAVTGTLFSCATLAAAVLNRAVLGDVPVWLQQVALAVSWSSAALTVPWMLLVLWFPDGQFTGRGWRMFAVVATPVAVATAVAGYLMGPAGRVPGLLAGSRIPDGLAAPLAGPGGEVWSTATDLTALLPLLAVPALAGRYRRSGPVVRQQVRWVLAAVCVTAVASVLAWLLPSGASPSAWVGTALVLAIQPLPALAIAAAVLRFRLWDVDLLVSGTVVYTVVWAGLSALLVLPAAASGYLVGGRTALGAVAVALLVTVAFQPVRSRVRAGVQAKLFGARRRGLLRLERFGASLRTAVAATVLGPQLADALRTGLRVSWAGAWMLLHTDDGDTLTLLGSSGGTLPERLPLTIELRAALALRGDPMLADEVPADLAASLGAPARATAPLVAQGKLVGLLACGDRPGEPLGEPDRAPLARFAGECALGLQALRLESELRARILQVQAQAAELQSSRRRLVRVQDQERRRIERDLHDGVQQQLVGLAARLRTLARSLGPAGSEECGQLADEAEDVVFAMQDLARGIFPGVLADQGLVPALRAQAARCPLPVRISVAPPLKDLRFDPQIEAALYFVALEALTNAAKHARDATVTMALRIEAAELILEVRDDGPGIRTGGAPNGTGLTNMRDRVGAVAGSLLVEALPRGGTSVRAAVLLSVAPGAQSTAVVLSPSPTPAGRSAPPRPVG